MSRLIARWERGYRTHGLWVGGTRVAIIGLPPHGFPIRYNWSIDRTTTAGVTLTLDDARKAVAAALPDLTIRPPRSSAGSSRRA